MLGRLTRDPSSQCGLSTHFFYALEVARSLDDAAEMFIRQVQKMHNKASDALVIYLGGAADSTDALVARLREIALAHKAEGTGDKHGCRRNAPGGRRR